MVLCELPTLRAGAATMPTKWPCIVKGGYSQRVDQTHQSPFPKLHLGPHKEAAHRSEPKLKRGIRRGENADAYYCRFCWGIWQWEEGKGGLDGRQGSVLHICHQGESPRAQLGCVACLPLLMCYDPPPFFSSPSTVTITPAAPAPACALTVGWRCMLSRRRGAQRREDTWSCSTYMMVVL